MKQPKILVVGSLVMDLIVLTPRFAERGETVIGGSFSTAAGGKGQHKANDQQQKDDLFRHSALLNPWKG